MVKGFFSEECQSFNCGHPFPQSIFFFLSPLSDFEYIYLSFTKCSLIQILFLNLNLRMTSKRRKHLFFLVFIFIRMQAMQIIIFFYCLGLASLTSDCRLWFALQRDFPPKSPAVLCRLRLGWKWHRFKRSYSVPECSRPGYSLYDWSTAY